MSAQILWAQLLEHIETLQWQVDTHLHFAYVRYKHEYDEKMRRLQWFKYN